MKSKDLVKFMAVASLSLSGFTGLSLLSLESVIVDAQESATAITLENSVIGKVTKIEGSQVTLNLGILAAMPTPPTPNHHVDSVSSATQSQNPDAEDSNVVADEEVSTSLELPNNITGGNAPKQLEESGEEVSYDLSNAQIVSEALDGEQEATLADISQGSVLKLEVSEAGQVTKVTIVNTMDRPGRMPGGQQSQGQMPDGQPPQGQMPGGQPGGGFGGSGEVTQGTSANTIEEDTTVSNETFSSTNDDENALRIVNATVELSNINVNKEAGASSNTEDGDFYGMNAGLLATDGANVTIDNATVNTSAQNGNGIFSYGSGTTVNVSNPVITTTADNSGGIQTTGGATTNASNLTVNTAGKSSAAIRSDRGGGIVNVEGGTYTTTGNNSPAAYSTAEINISDATLVAEDSEALVIEGQNSLNITNSNVTGNMSDTEGSSSAINVHNVMIYQSMSGDAEVGLSTFTMDGGTLIGLNGDMFYVTNTASTINLSNVTIDNQDTEANLMTISGNNASHGWGNAGANGAQVVVNADNQVLEGKIVVDTISTLTLNLTNGSVLTGSIEVVENAEGGEAVDNNAVVTIDASSTWNLTEDVTISSLDNQGTINFNGYTITLADGTVISE